MGTPLEDEPSAEVVLAAQRGDGGALDHLVSAYLPLVYNIVGRAMNGHHDVDDVVQETMIRAMRSIGDLRDPRAFRSWLVAITMRQVRDAYRSQVAQPPPVDMAREAAGPDFEEITIERLGLSGQRRETAEASRWLDEEDRSLLALWWQEAAGTLDRSDLAAALGQPSTHVAVAVARMKERLDASRQVVHALRQSPPCPQLMGMTTGWDGEPSPLWRKRLNRHVRECAFCLPGPNEMIPAERLLIGLGLVPLPFVLFRTVVSSLARVAATHATAAHAAAAQSATAHAAAVHAAVTAAGQAARHGRRAVRPASAAHHARLVPKMLATLQAKVVIVSVAVVTCAAGGTAAAAAITRQAPRPLPVAAATLVPRPARLTPPIHVATAKPAPKPAPTRAPTPSRTPTSKPTPTAPPTRTPPPAASVVTTSQKGVSAWSFTGATDALAKSGASWYYNWAATPSGITAPAGVSFVPMIWGPGSVTSSTLSEVKQEGNILLTFNEPDNGGQSNMTPQQALDLWPQLAATGMQLGSPAVAAGGDTPGGWLDQFMQGAQARGYRVSFITLHWYGGNFDTPSAVSELRDYIQAVYNRYHLPIWLTEFALTNFGTSPASFPTNAQQAAFATSALNMLAGLSYVQRYAWFALPTSTGSGNTGLFGPGAVATQVGQAFEAAGQPG
ncbi:MAG TPA: sigma-70 family RNA polymerase sigma factor [Trebonia sp.]|nr:sigma-70 family RNA polymerase sigma factor [Trebonia sp.]